MASENIQPITIDNSGNKNLCLKTSGNLGNVIKYEGNTTSFECVINAIKTFIDCSKESSNNGLSIYVDSLKCGGNSIKHIVRNPLRLKIHIISYQLL